MTQGAIIVLMGTTGVGKSTFIQTITGDKNITIGHGLESATRDVAEYPFQLDGKSGTLVDMPGYDDSTMPDVEMLSKTADWLAKSYEAGNKLNGILWLESLDKPRIGGSGKKALDLFAAVCGDDFLQNVILIYTMGNHPSFTAQQVIRANDLEHKYWATLISGRATTARFDKFDNKTNTGLTQGKTQARGIIRKLINKTANITKLQEEMVTEHLKFTDTGAGKFANKEYEEIKKKFEQQAEEFKQKIADAQQQGNKILEQLNKAQAKAAQDSADSVARQQAMMDQFAEERKRWRDLLMAKDQQTQSQTPPSTSGINLLTASELLKLEFPMTDKLRNPTNAEHRRYSVYWTAGWKAWEATYNRHGKSRYLHKWDISELGDVVGHAHNLKPLFPSSAQLTDWNRYYDWPRFQCRYWQGYQRDLWKMANARMLPNKQAISDGQWQEVLKNFSIFLWFDLYVMGFDFTHGSKQNRWRSIYSYGVHF